MTLVDLANPTRFLALAERLLPWLTAATLFAFAIGITQALFVAPDDYLQGATVKIMFIHVPSASRSPSRRRCARQSSTTQAMSPATTAAAAA